ncbi:IKI3 family-domain-containing protein [Syncephalis pseudoplumigaleata]|uniref:Elongator complex protein 1 n=1 Tax=Syncephalis pseudoplumigaleata TaxID=1712513 RepID=A0A4P9YUQ3_9FUNG|nr:IKI3 family-domain-containing protein [Syncephalis pseudoplumigaleata]|eukprot:RKP23763.1 IKI3 family-domain-containing protein [Syncephalis pseudoplumigaleata]
MKNLALLTPLSCPLQPGLVRAGRLCLDTVNRRVYIAECASGIVTVRCMKPSKAAYGGSACQHDLLVEFPIDDASGPQEDADQPSHIVHSQYLAEYDTICLAISTGELYTIPAAGQDTLDATMAECVGHVASGIKCMAWSPDEELVVGAGADDLLLMTSEFEVLSEKPLHSIDEGEDVAVNVGWGRKETQFHGSLGKQAALAPSTMPTSSIKQAPDETGAVIVSWRGDGSYFVCSALDPQRACTALMLLGHRLLRMFNREGLLQNTSEPTDALSPSLHWRPSGNWITTTQHQPHRQVVVLFERNGLRRHEFPLLDAQSKVKSILWNADSTILALWLVLPSGQQVVQLWTTSNYEWYLKQHLPVDHMVDVDDDDDE